MFNKMKWSYIMKLVLTPELLKPLFISSSGEVFVSKKITSTIESCVLSKPIDIKTKINYLNTEYKNQENDPWITINYNDPQLLEAYIINYLPRNTLVPKLGLLCCSYVPDMIVMKDRIKILDLGSGTGGISLGLLDLFSNPPLNKIKLDIFSLDISLVALKKQYDLITKYGLNGSSWVYHCADLTNPSTYKQFLEHNGSFDLIFSANVLSEMETKYIDNVLDIVRNYLESDGILISAESQNTPAKIACAYISQSVNKFGLTTFYPCPQNISCTEQMCWKWFNHRFICGDIRIGEEYFQVTKIHKIIWRIISKRQFHIYNYLHQISKDLNWGLTRSRTRDKFNYVEDELCTTQGKYRAIISPQLDDIEEGPWTHLVGINEEQKHIALKWSITDDISSCNSSINRI